MEDQMKKNDSVHSFDSWGLTNPDTIESYRERTKKWKPTQLKLVQEVLDVLKTLTPNKTTKFRPVWFISDGSLLGAFRTGKMIDHDYDFDFGICFVHEDGTVADLKDCKTEVETVGALLTEVLGKKYLVITNGTDYSYKIEVLDESSGVLPQAGASQKWYNAMVDIQAWYSPDGKSVTYAYFRDGITDDIIVDVSNVLPLTEIQFESLTFPCPKEPKTVLTAIYGYIGTPAKYNKETKKYEPAD